MGGLLHKCISCPTNTFSKLVFPPAYFSYPYYFISTNIQTQPFYREQCTSTEKCVVPICTEDRNWRNNYYTVIVISSLSLLKLLPEAEERLVKGEGRERVLRPLVGEGIGRVWDPPDFPPLGTLGSAAAVAARVPVKGPPPDVLTSAVCRAWISYNQYSNN